MTSLRAKFIRDLVIRGRSKNTQKAYTRCVCDLARYYHRSPELISYEEVTGWLYHLIKERQLSASSVNIAVSAVRFLYAVTLGRETVDLMASVPHMKRATRRAEVYARSEIEAILTASRQPRDRALLMTVYGCGLRISEATQLKTSDIDRARMQLRVRNGKGVKGRVLPLSERLLQELENRTQNREVKAKEGKRGGCGGCLSLVVLFLIIGSCSSLFAPKNSINNSRTLATPSPPSVPPVIVQATSTPTNTNVNLIAPSNEVEPHTKRQKLNSTTSSGSARVWVNTKTGVYHYPGTHGYGNTRQGRFESEQEAIAEGDRPVRNGH